MPYKVSPTPLITIDGPAGSGKSTAAERVARELNLAHFRSSNYFRLLGFELSQGADEKALMRKARSLNELHMLYDLQDSRCFSPEATKAAGQIADNPQFMPGFLELARTCVNQLPEGKKGLIADGRPLGTEVFHIGRFNAGVKMYFTATPEVRALRIAVRQREPYTPELQEEMQRRDKSDMQRKFLRLAKAPDAIELNTTNLSEIEVKDRVISRTLVRYPQLRR